MGDNRDSILEAAPSKPRAMLIPASVKVENSKPTSGTEPRTMFSHVMTFRNGLAVDVTSFIGVVSARRAALDVDRNGTTNMN